MDKSNKIILRKTFLITRDSLCTYAFRNGSYGSRSDDEVTRETFPIDPAAGLWQRQTYNQLEILKRANGLVRLSTDTSAISRAGARRFPKFPKTLGRGQKSRKPIRLTFSRHVARDRGDNGLPSSG